MLFKIVLSSFWTKMDRSLEYEAFKKFKDLLMNSLPFPDKLLDVAISIQKQFRRPTLANLNSINDLVPDSGLMEARQGRERMRA